MKKLLVAILLTGTFVSCDHGAEQLPPEHELPSESTISLSNKTCRTIGLKTDIDLPSSEAQYLWRMTSAADPRYFFADSLSAQATFAAAVGGQYLLELRVETARQSYTRHVKVSVEEPAEPFSPYVAEVIDFDPAPGQFINVLPEYVDGQSHEQMLRHCNDYIAAQACGSPISLGGYGGSIVLAFDHTIVNVDGLCDFRISGNAFYSADGNTSADGRKGGSCEPGIIMVAYDSNGNGVPDEQEWYEIAGTLHNDPSTIHNYEITYYRPQSEPSGASPEYIFWRDNLGHTGYKAKNTFHRQSYYPQWIEADSIVCRGTLLANNAVDQSGNGSYWVLYSCGRGYADNAPNTDDNSAIDIAWAVDVDGRPVKLPGVDFIKISTGINQECGWLGESSTEVCGASDLHLTGERIATAALAASDLSALDRAAKPDLCRYPLRPNLRQNATGR